MILDYHLWRESTTPDRGGAATAALLGDETARDAIADHMQETGEADVTPFEIGEPYMIETVTLYYVGRVKRIVGAFVLLEDASWVHWTGRLSVLHRLRKFTGFPATARKPRTEYLGEKWVSLASVVSFTGPPWDLPKESQS